MNCKKCSKKIPENIDYCASCNLAENPNYQKYIEENNAQTNNLTEHNVTKKAEDNVPISSINSIAEKKEVKSLVVYCKCGQKLEADWKNCPQCNTPITGKIKSNVKDNSNEQKKEKNQGNSSIFVAIFIVGIVFSFLFSNSIGFLVSIVTIITGKIKYPKNNAIKVLFWLSILAIILYVIFAMWLMATCVEGIQSCPG